MIDARGDFFLFTHDLTNPFCFARYHRANLLFQRRIIQINVSYLVVRHRKDLARAAVEQLKTEFLLHAQPACAPEQAVQMNWPIHWCDSVFGEQDDLDGLPSEEIN